MMRKAGGWGGGGHIGACLLLAMKKGVFVEVCVQSQEERNSQEKRT